MRRADERATVQFTIILPHVNLPTPHSSRVKL